MGKQASKFVPQGLQYLAGNITQKKNFMGSPLRVKASWASGLTFAQSCQTIFFAGCGYQYSSDLESLMSLIRSMDKSPLGIEFPAKLANSLREYSIDPVKLVGTLRGKHKYSDKQTLVYAIRILQALDYNPGYLSEKEPCCGGLLYYSGMEDTFMQNAKTAYKTLKACGVEEIISIVPSCTYTLKTLFPKYIDPCEIKVVHFLESVANKIHTMNLKLPAEISVTYHDPCQLSRYLEITAEPRHILQSIKGINLVETKGTNREFSTCCGGGGGFEAIFPELSERIACNRARELADTGAEVILTHCPGCILQIRHALKKLRLNNIKVMDITQIVAMAMGL